MMSYLIYILLSLFLFTACDGGHDEEVGSARVLPIHIRIKTTEGSQQRVPGDPGEAEQFPLPSVAYIYVLANSAADGTGAPLLQMIDGAANKGKVNLDPDLWEQDDKDPSIYHYGGALNISLWHMAQSAKVYVAVADREIPGIALPSLPEDIVSLTYDPSQVPSQVGGDVNEFMKNLYSTPYNKPVSADDATYYGTVEDLHTNTPSVNVMLYHVAAKLDIKWNVAEGVRTNNALTHLRINDLPAKCYLFKPTELVKDANTGKTSPYNTTYEVKLLDYYQDADKAEKKGYASYHYCTDCYNADKARDAQRMGTPIDAIGTAWSGRRVVYVPQHYLSNATTLSGTAYALNFTVGVNGDKIATAWPYGHTLPTHMREGELFEVQQDFQPDAVFASWIAVNLNIDREINYPGVTRP